MFPKKSPLTCELLNYSDILSCVYHTIENILPKCKQQAICLACEKFVCSYTARGNLAM